MSLDQQVKTLFNLQSEYAQRKAELDERRKAWEAENAALIATVDQLKDGIAQCDETVREAAMKAFLDTGEKSPHPAITIKAFAEPEYEDDLAIEWAWVKAPEVFDLNRKKYELLLKSGLFPDMPGAVVDVHKVTLARDLSKFA